jgi:hypothetical protein
MITMTDYPVRTTSNRQIDECRCVWDYREWYARLGAGAPMELARMLVEAGCPDQPWETRTRTGTRSLFGPSLQRLARLTLERERGGIERAQYHPRTEMPFPSPREPSISGSRALPLPAFQKQVGRPVALDGPGGNGMSGATAA